MKTQSRKDRLMPGGIPRYVRCYDDGGEFIDRYTVLFTGRYRHLTGGAQWYLAMDRHPMQPQGFGQHGECSDIRPMDCDRWNWPPKIGGKCHLGKRIAFSELPPDCQSIVLRDYIDLWDIE